MEVQGRKEVKGNRGFFTGSLLKGTVPSTGHGHSGRAGNRVGDEMLMNSFNFKVMPGRPIAVAREYLEMKEGRLGKRTRLEIQILAGQKVLSGPSHLCMQVCMDSFIHSFALYSSIHLLFTYPSIS